jgi:hypothetical protein
MFLTFRLLYRFDVVLFGDRTGKDSQYGDLHENVSELHEVKISKTAGFRRILHFPLGSCVRRILNVKRFK